MPRSRAQLRHELCLCRAPAISQEAGGTRPSYGRRPQVVHYLVPLFERLAVMSITASEARKGLFPLIKKVNEDHDAIEIVSKHGNAVLVSAEDYAALREGAYLLRSPANARRLLKAYENALNGIHL